MEKSFSARSLEDLIKQITSNTVAHACAVINDPEFTQLLKVKVDRRGDRGYGGSIGTKPYIKIPLRYYERFWNAGFLTFYEYRSFAKSPLIGTVHSCTPKMNLVALVCHEVAHAFQYYSLHKAIRERTVDSSLDYSPHGKFWKSIYSKLRQAVVNGKEYPMNDEIVAAPKAPATRRRKYETVAIEKDGGRYVKYVSHEGAVLGEFFTKFQQPVQIKTDEGYVETQYLKLVDARKEYVDERLS